MLGRYIAGTLLVLGAAMAVAPDAPDNREIAVARTETVPVALASAEPAAMAAAAQKLSRETVVRAAVPDGSVKKDVEAAVAQALALDLSEGAAPKAVAETEDSQPEAFVFSPADDLLLAAISPEEVTTAIAEPLPEPQRRGRQMFVTGSKVNVRSGPSTQYRIVGSVSSGDPVELIAFEGANWARIRLEDGATTGYMSRRFLASGDADG